MTNENIVLYEDEVVTSRTIRRQKQDEKLKLYLENIKVTPWQKSITVDRMQEKSTTEPPMGLNPAASSSSSMKDPAPPTSSRVEVDLPRGRKVAYEDNDLEEPKAKVRRLAMICGIELVPCEEPAIERKLEDPMLEYQIDDYPTDQLAQAMKDEMDSMKSFGVYDEIDKHTLSADQRRSAMPTRWVHRWKTPTTIKSRLVCKGFYERIKDLDDVYASTPTIVSLRTMLTMALARGFEIKTYDISTAFLHADVQGEVYVEPPIEFYPEKNVLWKLRKAMYGLRTAPKCWQNHLCSTLENLGLFRLVSDPNVYTNKRDIYVVAYVDDLLLIGITEAILDFAQRLSEKLLVKHCGDLIDGNTIRFLGRELYRIDSCIYFRMPGYVDAMALELSITKGVKTTGYTAVKHLEDGDEELCPEEHKQFRGIVGKLMWLCGSRPDLCFATKELARGLSAPTREHMARAMHAVKYAIETKDYALKLYANEQLDSNSIVQLDAYSDSDWAGCVATRRSTSGVAILLCGSTVSYHSRTQTSVALSSAEAELYAIGSAAVEALAVQQLLQEAAMARDVKIRLLTDSTSAKSMACRYGQSKLSKHIALRHLFVQDLIKNGTCTIGYVNTRENLADLFTKHLSADVRENLSVRLGVGSSDNYLVATISVITTPSASSAMSEQTFASYESRCQACAVRFVLGEPIARGFLGWCHARCAAINPSGPVRETILANRAKALSRRTSRAQSAVTMASIDNQRMSAIMQDQQRTIEDLQNQLNAMKVDADSSIKQNVIMNWPIVTEEVENSYKR